MAKRDITSLDQELRQGKILPAYVIVGEESFLRLGSLALIKEKILTGDADDLALRTFSARDAKASEVISALKNITLLGNRPLVILQDGEYMTRDRGKELQEALAAYLAAPVKDATLVVVAEKLDGRSRWMQAANKQNAIIDCKKLYDDKLPSWIGLQVRRRNRQISQEAARFLADMVGNDLGQLAQSIDRIILYAGERKALELRDVEEAVTDTHQRDIFDLTDAVGQRRLSRALSYLHNLIVHGQPPTLILHMLARHFRILIKAKDLAGRGQERSVAASYLGVNPFYVGPYLDQARNFSRGELRTGFALLHRCDREIKSSRLPRERILERALVSLCEKDEGPAM